MRILHVVPTYLPAVRHGGSIWAIHGLARELARRGHEVKVVTTDIHGSGRLTAEEARNRTIEGVAVTYCRARWPRRLAWSPALRREVRAAAPGAELVHLHSVFLTPTLLAARAAARAKRPFLVSPHGMLVADLINRRGSLRKRAWLALFERRTLREAAAVVATSELERAEIARLGLRTVRLELVPNGVDLFDLARPVPEPVAPAVRAALGRQPLLLCLGRVSWKKGIGVIVEALPRLAGVTLAIAGPDEGGESARLRALSGRLGVDDRVLFLGHVEGADREALFRRASLLVLPSVSENFALVVAEALGAATPVVVSPGVGLAELIKSEQCGRVVEPAAEPWAVALRELLAEPAALAEMGKRGRRAVERRFSWEVVGREMEALYETVLAAAGEGAEP